MYSTANLNSFGLMTLGNNFGMLNSLFGNKFSKLHAEAKKGEQEKSCLSYEKIKSELGWEPSVSLAEGVKKVFEKQE